MRLNLIGLLTGTVLLAGCVSRPPTQVDNICSIFHQYPRWYRDAFDVQQRWKIPIAVQMAIVHQESKFNGSARPLRRKLLGVIPWARPSTAYGYSQALTSTWAIYRGSKNGGGHFAVRDSFVDAVDFIGWYANEANQRAGISRSDAYRLYLAYHEGVGGYQRQTYLAKPWLMLVAKKVEVRAKLFEAELKSCHVKNPHRWGLF